MTETKTLLLDKLQIEQKINRLAYQVYEDCADENGIIIAGIAPNGFKLAERLAGRLQEISPLDTRLVKVAVSDKENPIGNSIELGISEEELRDKVIILVDDVLNSGKTLIYSLKVFLKVPIKKLRTVILVDRNHKRYPVSADFVGLSLSTTMQEHVSVVLDGMEAVYLS